MRRQTRIDSNGVIVPEFRELEMSSVLFTPLSIGRMELPNRITVAPMCQYSAVDGTMTDWHMQHLGNLALSGASMLVIEATGVGRKGASRRGCTGLYSDANEAAMKRVVDFVRTISPIRIGVQLERTRAARLRRSGRGKGAGRSRRTKAHGRRSRLRRLRSRRAGRRPPRSTARAWTRVRDAFVAAARRAARIGLDFIEMHSTHGYLLSEFLSPLSNQRERRIRRQPGEPHALSARSLRVRCARRGRARSRSARRSRGPISRQAAGRPTMRWSTRAS